MKFVTFLLIAMLLAAGSVEPSQKADNTQGAPASLAPVLVELFTSEGCSTCPPADKLLTELDQNLAIKGVEIITLSEHVDYWNRLGWKDPFSSAQFSQRQSDYTRALSLEDIYTPQMVVDGRTAFVGSKRSIAINVIGKAARTPKATVNISIATATQNSLSLKVDVGGVPEISRGDKADVMLAVAESGLVSKVSRGENSGHELSHSSVTRKLSKIGTFDGGIFSGEQTVQLESGWKRQNLKIAVFVQERNKRRVLGAAAIRLKTDS